MVFWFNHTPNSDGNVPAKLLYTYETTLPKVSQTNDCLRDIGMNPYQVGDTVYLKPVNAKCTTVWRKGVITELVSNTAAKVDGTTRHIADMRLAARHSSNHESRDELSNVSMEVDTIDAEDESDLCSVISGTDTDSSVNGMNSSEHSTDSSEISSDGNPTEDESNHQQLGRGHRIKRVPAYLADYEQ